MIINQGGNRRVKQRGFDLFQDQYKFFLSRSSFIKIIYILSLKFLFFKVTLVLRVAENCGKSKTFLLDMVMFSQDILRVLRHSKTSKNTVTYILK